MNKMLMAAPVAALIALALPASATVISTLPGGTALPIPGTNQLNFSGPATIAPGVTFTSTQPSAYGYTGSYGFNGNGTWSGAPMIGLDRGSGYFEIAFATPLSAFLADTNWTNLDYAGDATIEIFDAANVLLETLVLENAGTNLVAPGFWGFSRSAGDISRVRFSNEYVGIREITTSAGVAAVPEPATWAMMLAGFGIVGGAMRRRQRTSVSFA
jgi:hypothetical protein